MKRHSPFCRTDGGKPSSRTGKKAPRAAVYILARGAEFSEKTYGSRGGQRRHAVGADTRRQRGSAKGGGGMGEKRGARENGGAVGADTRRQRGVRKAAEVWGKNEVRGKMEVCGGSRYAAATGERERRRRYGGKTRCGGQRRCAVGADTRRQQGRAVLCADGGGRAVENGGAVGNGGVRWRLCYSYENAKKRGHQVDAPMQY